MKTTKCVLCGRNFSLAEETVCGQHVLCPYCGGKFSYLSDSPEFSTERLSYAIAECRKEGDSRRYYDAAPAGARLYIGLVFYGKVFRDHLDRDLYIAEMAEIESELKDRDWSYLLKNESDPELADYFRSKLPEETVEEPKRKNPSEVYAKPKIGIIRPQPAGDGKKGGENQPETVFQPMPTRKAAGVQPIHFVLAACVIGVLLVGIILFQSVSRSSDHRKPDQTVDRAIAEKEKAQDDLLETVSKRLSELNERKGQIERAIEEVRADKNLFVTELNRTIGKGNIRAAESQSKGKVRLNEAETAMSILKAPFFNAFAIRYCGDRPFEKAETCRRKVQQILDASGDLTADGIESLNQLAIACQENAVGEVRRAIDEKYDFLVALRKSVSNAIRELRQEQCEIPHVDGKGFLEKKKSLDSLFQTEAFTAAYGLADIAGARAASAPTEDVFSLSGKIRSAPVGERHAVAVKTDDGEVVRRPSQEKASAAPEKKVTRSDENPEAEVQPAAEPGRKEATVEVKAQKAKGRRQKCKSPIKCMNFAEPGHNFCLDHECQSYGCKEHVRTVTMPNWPNGGLRSISSLTPTQRERIKGKCIGHYCPKHCCNRICPQIKDYHEWWSGYLNWDNDKTEQFFFCDKERLAKSRYCADHACPVSTCGSSCEEVWKLENGTSSEEKEAVIGPLFWWCHWRNWILVKGSSCRSHSALDPQAIPRRDLRTASDLLREKEELRAKK